MRKFALRGVFGLVLAALLTACAARDDAAIPTDLQDNIPASSLPALPDDAWIDPAVIESRRTTAVGTLSVLGDQMFSTNVPAVQIDDTDHACLLAPGAAELDWAIYRFDNLLATDTPLVLDVHLLGELPPGPCFVAVSDYTGNTWSFTELAAPAPQNAITISGNTNPLSAAGNVYLAIVAYDGLPLNIGSLHLTLNCPAPPPQGFNVDPGDCIDLPVHLSWTDPAFSYDEGQGFAYNRIVIQRADSPSGPWSEIGEAPPGVTFFDDMSTTGQPGNPHFEGLYYYRISTEVIGVNSPYWSSVIDGLMQLFVTQVIARFSVAPLTGTAPVSITFDGSASTIEGGALVQARWDYDGDGVWDHTSASDLVVSHSFSKNGRYYPRLELTMSLGSKTMSDTVTGYLAIGDKRGDWSQERRNPQHNSGSPIRGPKAAGSPDMYTSPGTLYSPVIGADNKVYIGDSQGYLNVINPDCTLDHRVDLLSGNCTQPPALDKNGNVWINVNNGGDPQLTCVFPDNSVHTYAAAIGGTPSVTPDGTYLLCAVGKTLFQATPTPQGGDPGWYHKKYDWSRNIYRPAVSRDGFIYTLDDANQYNKFDLNLGVIYTAKWPSWYGMHEPTISSSGYLYNASDWPNLLGDFYVHIAKSTGESGGFFTLPGQQRPLGAPGFGPDGTAYISSQVDTVSSFAGGIKPTYAYTLGAGTLATTPVVDGDGRVYVCSSTGTLFCLSNKLTFKWSYALGAGPSVQTALAIGNDGSLFAASGNKLRAFRP